MNNNYDILVVEDELIVLSAIQKITEPERLRVDTAVDVDSAMEKLSRNTYRLIISDLMLPKISGFDFIRLIKEKHPRIPLIVITGYATLENALQSFKMGSFDFIPKPFDTEAFLGVVWRGIRYSEKMKKFGPDSQFCIPKSAPEGMDAQSCDYYCLGDHAWSKLTANGTALIGIGNTFPNMIEGIERIELNLPNDEIVQGKCCAQFVSKDCFVNMFWAPLSGSVTARNQKLEDNVHLINTSGFAERWLFRIIPYNPDEELEHLTCCEQKPGHQKIV